jgi:hypothetical protein
MPVYRVRRHVIYKPGCQQTEEVWGIDRAAPRLRTVSTPRSTDADDPLRQEECGCPQLLQLSDGRWVTWSCVWEWLSEAEAAGYELVSGYQKLSPYSTLVIRSA